ncbi:hypothetical protein SB751_34770, partial [Cupriavidus sp. SIMBA_020]|uniref:hypothetical protein n=1 Tax=Cupriavidus sp. SIMBA_020 TaxID=3085766 RepID=UPI00397A40A5
GMRTLRLALARVGHELMRQCGRTARVLQEAPPQWPASASNRERRTATTNRNKHRTRQKNFRPLPAIKRQAGISFMLSPS